MRAFTRITLAISPKLPFSTEVLNFVNVSNRHRDLSPLIFEREFGPVDLRLRHYSKAIVSTREVLVDLNKH
jgi:hypothetical protein